ncbi:MAG: MBL fold metallo-hydrolase [Xanthomonadales bacterium]|nr:MBL fold metallo-hydrolase [Xanthomonadales bacterium]
MKNITWVLGLLISGLTLAKEEPKVSFATTQVGDGIYMLQGEGGFTGGNLGLLVGDDGVVLIDDSMPPFMDIMTQAIKELTDQSIDFLINTHVHGDHTGNNTAMGGHTHIVAHDNLRAHMVKNGIQTGEGMIPAPKDALPVLTFSDQMTFHFNGQPATAIHVPHAHTDGDAFIHFNKANVIHTGDVFFNGLFPFIDLDSGGSVDGYIHAQMKIISMSDDDTKIIPGHGPLGNKKDLQAAVDMLIDAKSIIAKHIEKGDSLETILEANPLQKYHDDWNWGFITTERMTQQLFNGLSKTHSHQDGKEHSH